MTKIQYFHPKDKGVLKRAARTENAHPNLEDIKQMAQDTVNKTKQPKQVLDAIRTLIEIEEIKEKKK